MFQIIQYQTAAETRDYEFFQKDVDSAIILDVAAGWAGTETIPLHYVGHDGTRITPVLESETAVALSVTRPEFHVKHACKIRMVKPVTVAAVGVNLHGRD